MSFNQALTQLITSVTTVIGILVMMLSINVPMTIIAILILPVSSLFVMKIIKKSQKYFALQQEYLGHVNGNVEEMFGGHNVIKRLMRKNVLLVNSKKIIINFMNVVGKVNSCLD